LTDYEHFLDTLPTGAVRRTARAWRHPETGEISSEYAPGAVQVIVVYTREERVAYVDTGKLVFDAATGKFIEERGWRHARRRHGRQGHHRPRLSLTPTRRLRPRLGRAGRPSTNSRRRGSRRVTGSRSSSSRDDDPESDFHSRLPVGGRR
jgi:hypothetical protein